jgi:2-oxoglutarate dehydrogenase complex dehydrogenase (E1) component-like enzyme
MRGIDSVALANKDYVAEQYRRYKADPASVGEEWAVFFAGFELALSDGGNGRPPFAGAPSRIEPAASPAFGVFDLVHSYRELGHLVADLNPLDPTPRSHPLLDPSEFGFTDDDSEPRGVVRRLPRLLARNDRRLIARLRATYCRTLGVSTCTSRIGAARLAPGADGAHVEPAPRSRPKTAAACSTRSSVPRASSSSSTPATRPPSASRSKAANR